MTQDNQDQDHGLIPTTRRLKPTDLERILESSLSDIPEKPEIIKLITELGEDNTRQHAKEQLVQMGNKVVPALIAAYQICPTPGLSQFTSELSDPYTPVIDDIGAGATPHLLQFLKSPDAATRFRVVNALMSIKPKQTQAVPALLEYLQSAPDYIHHWSDAGQLIGEVESALLNIGIPAEEDREKLVSLISHNNVDVSYAAITLINHYPPRSILGVPCLIATLKKETLTPHYQSAKYSAGLIYALGNYGEKAKEAVPMLIDLIDASRNFPAVKALGNIGPEAQEAIPHLIEAMKDHFDAYRKTAVVAIGKIVQGAQPKFQEMAVQALNSYSKNDSEPEVQTAARQVLQEIGDRK